jgi:hypothetical protein
LPARKTIFAMHKRTSAKSGGRQPAVGVSMVIATEYVASERCSSAPWFGQADLHRRETAVCAGRRCIGASGYHGGLTPPALVLRVRTCAGEKNNFCDAQTHISKERRASARRGCEYRNCNGVRFRRERRSSARRGSTNAPATPIPHTFADTRRVQRQERRELARRGYRNSFAETQARLFGGPPAAYVQVAVALALLVTTGGLRPPLLSCECGRVPVRKTIFAMHKRTSAKSGGR